MFEAQPARDLVRRAPRPQLAQHLLTQVRVGVELADRISSRSASVNILRTLTVLLIGSVSPTIYTKINCYDRLGSRSSRVPS